MPIESNLFSLKCTLELKTGYEYTWGEIATAANLNVNTLYALKNNTSQGIRYETLASLLQFFRDRGLEIQVADLFVERRH